MDILADQLGQEQGYVTKEDLLILAEWAFDVKVAYSLLLLILDNKVFVRIQDGEPQFSKQPCAAIAQNLN